MRRRTGFLLFVASLLVYNPNFREISQTDTIPTRLLPLAILHEHRLNLNTFFRDHIPGTPLPFIRLRRSTAPGSPSAPGRWLAARWLATRNASVDDHGSER